MTYEVTREFATSARSAIGEAVIGKTTFTVDGKGKFALDGKELPDESARYLMTFALQSLQDAYAGAESEEDAIAAWGTKLTRIVEGTIGVRTGGGGGVDEFTRVARMIVRKAFKDNNGADSDARKAFMALDDAEQSAKLDEWFAANETDFRPVVEEEVASRKAERERRAKLAKATSFDI